MSQKTGKKYKFRKKIPSKKIDKKISEFIPAGKYLKIFFVVLVLINFFFASWFVLNGDLLFSSDIARDFLLYNQVAQKHFILIGPKSSVMGLFHGPLWIYLNFPAYLIGRGNPLFVGWWWVIMTAIYTGTCYVVADKLFGRKAAYFYALIMSLYMSFHTSGFINPIGAMFCIPTFFYFFVRYVQTLKAKYLIAHIFVLGLMIQFELAIGIPFAILSFLYLFIKIILSKHKAHLLSFFVILIPLSTFILFDVRHGFLMTHAVLRYLSPSSGNSVKYNFGYLIYDRFRLLISQVEFVRPDPNNRNLIASLIFIGFLVNQIKNNKYKIAYFSFIYFYVGYFVTTFINRGPILSFYFYPIFSLVFLIFASFVTSKYSKLFILIFAIIYIMNSTTAVADARANLKSYMGNDQTSWKFLNEMSSKVFQGNEKEFGYFVYTPDTIGYAPKYAMLYQQNVYKDKTALLEVKEPTTYIIVVPPASNNPYLSYEWWKENEAKITKNPISTIAFGNGYKIEKYSLTSEEMKIAPVPNIDPGLGFR